MNKSFHTIFLVAAALALTGAAARADGDGLYVSLEKAIDRMPKTAPIGATHLIVVDPDAKILINTGEMAGWGTADVAPPGHGADIAALVNPAFAPAQPPDPNDPMIDILTVAYQFGRTYQSFGHLSALVPRTMTVLSMPSTIDGSNAGVPIDEAVRVLLGSLTDDEWREAAGDGLAVDDLTPDQHDLFQSMLGRPIDVAPANLPPPSNLGPTLSPSDQAYYQSVKHLEAEQIASASSLHLSFTHEAIGQTGSVDQGVDFRVIALSDSIPYGGQPLSGVAWAVENSLKDSQLATRDFIVKIPLKKMQTVGDIIASIAAATHVELYCDPRYASRNVLVLGQLEKSAECDELMSALRLSLCATWRKVGPAYVLTDDLAGFGTRRRAIASNIDSWTDRLQSDLTHADAVLTSRAASSNTPAHGVLTALHVSFDIPDVGRVAFQDLSFYDTRNPVRSAVTPTAYVDPTPTAPAPDVGEPSTAADAVQWVDDQAADGAQSIYIDAFRDGQAYFQTKAQPQAADVVGPAAVESKSKDVRLFAVVDLLQWRSEEAAHVDKDPPAWRGQVDEDVTIDGLTAHQAVAEDVAAGRVAPSSPIVDYSGGDWVSPADSRVGTCLTGVLRDLAAIPGISGIVLRDTVPPGYFGRKDPLAPSRVDLGFNDAMRLLYLRQNHEDPIDVDDPIDEAVRLGPISATLDVPGFGYLMDRTKDLPHWRTFLKNYGLTFVAGLVQTIRQTTQGLPVYIERYPGGPFVRFTDEKSTAEKPDQ